MVLRAKAFGIERPLCRLSLKLIFVGNFTIDIAVKTDPKRTELRCARKNIQPFPLIVPCIIRVSRVQLLFNLRTSITRYRVTALRVSQPIAAQWIFIGRNSTARGKFIAQRDVLLRRCIITRISLHRGNDTLGFTLYIRSNPVQG